MEIKTEKKVNPPRILLYGVAGIGKSTFGASLPAPIFIDIEGGADEIGVPRFNVPKTHTEIENQLDYLIKTEHQYKSVVIDSIDWLERLIHSEVAAVKGVSDISAIPFGQGYSLALKYLDDVLSKLDILRNEKRMIVCLLAHAKISKFEDPTSANYDRYGLDLRDKAAAAIIEWSDMVLFANYKYIVRKEAEKFGEKIMKGVGSGERVIYAEERPAFIAKNRYGLPNEMTLSWSKIVETLKGKKENGN